MSRGKRLEIELKPRDRQQVEKLLAGGVQAVRPALRAWPCASPDRLLAEPASPTCSSIRSDVPRRASHESAARSDRSTCPGKGPEPLPPAPSALAGYLASAGAGPAIPGGLVLRSASAIDASAAR